MDPWRGRALVRAGLVLACGAGCAPEAVKAVETDDTHDTSPGPSCAVGDGESGDERSCIQPDRDVDLLFVIDNSGSMGEEQGKLLESAQALIDVLEGQTRTINYRIAFTTTDNGNPWCGATTSPEGGQFVLESCRGRLEHFVFTGTSPDNEVADIACTDWCALEPDELDDRMIPTVTDHDPEPRVRPWIESIEGQTNLPPDVSTLDAFRCFAPQGIDGCGFESHLESMYKALQRPKVAGEASYGFLRDHALLVVVILTDEADCSHDAAYEEIFETDGGKLFWSDPEAKWPTSAVCWNAGVECTGGPGIYDECHAENYGLDGLITDDPDAAVLRPVSRYTDLLHAIEDHKRQRNPDSDIIVSVIGGVPSGYADGTAELVYADTDDAVFQGDFGIGPGCTASDGTYTHAVPPVRLRHVAEAFPLGNLRSVCGDDYTHALDDLDHRLQVEIRPACYRDCVRDLDPDTPGLQPECVLEQQVPNEPNTEIPPCDIVDQQHVLPTDQDDVCYGLLTDPTQSGPAYDDMSDECIDEGWNLEILILRRKGVPAPGGTAVTGVCQLSEDPDVDCPGL